jgi:hypothetical protein
MPDMTRRSFLYRLIGAPIGAAMGNHAAQNHTKAQRQAVIQEAAKDPNLDLPKKLHKVEEESETREPLTSAGGALLGASVGGLVDYSFNQAIADVSPHSSK